MVIKQGINKSCKIGENIKNFRVKQGMTQEQLASKMQVNNVDISRGTLAKIEVGIRHISVDELEAIKEILDMEYHDFFAK